MKKLSLNVLEEFLSGLPWESSNFYEAWLAQTYYYTSHSTRLLEFCGFYTKDKGAAERYREHREEEHGHERIALSDLKRLGGDIALHGEHLSTRKFYWQQYEIIRHQGDRPFLGYVLMLELLARDYGPGIFEEVSAAHGDRCANFLKIHIEEDIDHVESAAQLLQSFSAEEQAAVVDNFNWSLDCYRAILKDCVSFADVRRESEAESV
ncbi:iron-containing redox enzyme family protein [Microbulbifer taiwanensis]